MREYYTYYARVLNSNINYKANKDQSYGNAQRIHPPQELFVLQESRVLTILAKIFSFCIKFDFLFAEVAEEGKINLHFVLKFNHSTGDRNRQLGRHYCT